MKFPKFLKKGASRVAVGALLAATAASNALAQVNFKSGQTVGDISGNITASLQGAGTAVLAFCYVGAIVFGLIGAMKWKAYGEQPERTPLKIPVTYWAIAVLLAALPEFLGTGIATIWGGGGTDFVTSDGSSTGGGGL